MPSRRTLARRLESVDGFPDPAASLEQYVTPPEIAAHICHLAKVQGDLTERRVVDLGTGTGMLAIGASLAGAARVVGVDVDGNALDVSRRNAADLGVSSSTQWVHAEVARSPLCCTGTTVLSNPPFGAQHGNRHADRAFLECASAIAAVSYTVHNEGSEAFVETFAADEGGEVTHAFRATLDLERQFDFHTSASKTLDAEVFRIEWTQRSTPSQ